MSLSFCFSVSSLPSQTGAFCVPSLAYNCVRSFCCVCVWPQRVKPLFTAVTFHQPPQELWQTNGKQSGSKRKKPSEQWKRKKKKKLNLWLLIKYKDNNVSDVVIIVVLAANDITACAQTLYTHIKDEARRRKREAKCK